MGYTNADSSGSPFNRNSTSGCCVLFGVNLIYRKKIRNKVLWQDRGLFTVLKLKKNNLHIYVFWRLISKMSFVLDYRDIDSITGQIWHWRATNVWKSIQVSSVDFDSTWNQIQHYWIEINTTHLNSVEFDLTWIEFITIPIYSNNLSLKPLPYLNSTPNPT